VTKQETFDFVVTSVIAQDGPSVDADGNCAYRGNDGRKCAAGHCISDDQYDSSFEGVGVNGGGRLPQNDPVRAQLAKAVAGHDLILLACLQRAHDWSVIRDGEVNDELSLEQFRDRAADLARDFNLSSAILGGAR
jgi:hypothetical protein